MTDQERYEVWMKEGKTQWTSDDGMWAIKSFVGFKVTGIVHFCDPDSPSGRFATENAKTPSCQACNEQVPDGVQGLWILQNLDSIPNMKKSV